MNARAAKETYVDRLIAHAASYGARIELQRQGFIPPPMERQQILLAAHHLTQGIRSIDTDIQWLITLRARMSMGSQLAINASILAPIRRLPQELLSHIFVLFAMEIDPCMRAHTIRDTVARVCREWYTVARSTPRLWTYISSTLHDLPPSSPSRYSAQAALAGGLPLHLEHGVGDEDYEIDDVLLESFLEELLPYASRWQCIRLNSSGAFFAAFHVGELIALEEAQIYVLPPLESGAAGFLAGASGLRRLVLSYQKMDGDDDEENIITRLSVPAFPQLEDLTVIINTYIDMQPFLSLLRGFSNSLHNLSVFAYFSDLENAYIPPVELIALETVMAYNHGYRLLDHLVTPVLEEIVIEDVYIDDHGDPFPLLSSFSSRAHRYDRLKRLTIIDVSFYDVNGANSFLQCAPALHWVEELHVRDSVSLMTEEVLQGLTCASDKAPLLPNLAHLTLLGSRRPSRAWKVALRAMVASRKVPRVCASQTVVALKDIVADVEY
ncbi:hypothetical protein GGG16DRAFT_86742 [Schizophyllum commune]